MPMDQARRYPPRQARLAATTFRINQCRRQPVENYRYKFASVAFRHICFCAASDAPCRTLCRSRRPDRQW
jgi:hypothetical protein